MTIEKYARPLTAAEVRLLGLVKLFRYNRVAEKMKVSTGALYVSVRRILIAGETTDRYISRVKKAISEIQQEEAFFVGSQNPLNGQSLDGHDNNNQNIYPYLKAVLEKCQNEVLLLGDCNRFVLTCFDLVEKYGEAKGLEMALVFFED